MKNIFYKVFVILAATFLLSSCALKDMMSRNKPVKIRIVGLDGKYQPLKTRTPELNTKILSSNELMEEEKKKIIENSNVDKKIALEKSKLQNQVTKTKDVEPVVIKEGDDADVVARPKPVKQLFKEDNVTEFDLSDGEAKKSEAQKIDAPIKKPIFISSKGVSEKSAKSPSVKKSFVISEKSSKKIRGIFVQVGSFSNANNANKSYNKMKKFNKGFIDEVVGKNKKTTHRVLLGPISSKSKAMALVSKIKASGHDAIIVRKR